MSVQETVWEIEPHTIAKHDILRRYLGAWFAILSTANDKLIFIDGFCGPGRYKGGEDGSPIIALDVASSHKYTIESNLEYWFIDKRRDRIDQLKGELSKKSFGSNFNVIVECGKFHEIVDSHLNDLSRSEIREAPIFAFIDPFGYSGIPYTLMERLLKRRSCEVFINFSVDSINRWLESSTIDQIISAFGTEEVANIAKESSNRIADLRSLYQKQLRKIGHFVRFFEMRDKEDRLIYDLFFASNNRKGHIKMKEAMWKVDPDGDFRFSDATNPNQAILFDTEHNEKLARILYDYFRGRQGVTGKEILEFVENDTVFLDSHKRTALIALETSNPPFITVETLKSNGKKRRNETYPKDVLINFI